MGKLLLVLFSIVSLYSNNVFSPSWFNPTNTEKYSYGYGKTINEAKLDASHNLALELDKNISIDDFTIVKQENFENKYFIKIKYINEDLLTQVKKELNKLAFKDEELENSYLKQTKFYKDLNNSFGYFPNVELHDNYLYFKDKRFLIKQSEFYNFFVEIDDENLSIDVKDTVKENEKFFFEISNNYDGYLTLAIYIKNNLSVLFKNKQNIKKTIYPNYKVSDGFSLEVNDNMKYEQAFVILTLCKEQKDLKSYKMIYEELNDKNNLTFSDFINEISDCKIATKIIKVIK